MTESVTVYGDPPDRVRVDGQLYRLIETTPGPTAERQWQWGDKINPPSPNAVLCQACDRDLRAPGAATVTYNPIRYTCSHCGRFANESMAMRLSLWWRDAQ